MQIGRQNYKMPFYAIIDIFEKSFRNQLFSAKALKLNTALRSQKNKYLIIVKTTQTN